MQADLNTMPPPGAILRLSTDTEPMALLLPWPGKPGFWDQVRPHVLRLVRLEGESSADADPLPALPLRLRPLVYVVRPGREEEDVPALDAALAAQAGPTVIPVRDQDGALVDTWRLFSDDPNCPYFVQLAALAAKR